MSQSDAKYVTRPAVPNQSSVTFNMGNEITIRTTTTGIEFHSPTGPLLRMEKVLDPLRWGEIYSSPEKLGLETIAELDIAGSYEFDMVVVWRQVKSGALYAGHDSGCSCPSPFENVTGLDDLTYLRSLDDIRPLVPKGGSMANELVFLNKVREVLRVG